MKRKFKLFTVIAMLINLSLINVCLAQNEPPTDSSRKPEPSSSTDRTEPKNDTNRKPEPSTDATKKTEPKTDSGRKPEPPTDAGRGTTPSIPILRNPLAGLGVGSLGELVNVVVRFVVVV